MNPVEPTSPLSVTLQAQEWNQVIFYLGKQAYENVASLIGKIGEQAQSAAGQAPMQPLANGRDTAHVSD